MSKEFEVIEEMQLATMNIRIIKIKDKYYWQQWDILSYDYIPYLDDLSECYHSFDTFEEAVDDARGTDDNQVFWDLGSYAERSCEGMFQFCKNTCINFSK